MGRIAELRARLGLPALLEDSGPKRARVGVCEERWDGENVFAAHVFPTGADSEAWRVDDALVRPERLSPEGHRTRTPICGGASRPHFLAGARSRVWLPRHYRPCPVCVALDPGMRLPG